MSPTEKLKKVSKLCAELQEEDNEAIVTGRIEGLAKELGCSPYQCALVYWAMKEQGEFISIFGPDIRVKFRAT